MDHRPLGPLLSGFGEEEGYIDELLRRFEPREPDMKTFALRNRVVLVRSSKGIGIDIALGGLPFEERVIERSSPYEYAKGIQLRTCSAEDLVVMKAFAEREQDWLDVRGILVRQGHRLDWPTILRELRPLAELKEAPAIIERLEALWHREDPTEGAQ